MPESVEFQLKLQDMMSAALHGAAGAATKLEDSLKKTASTVEHFGKAEEAAGHHSRSFGEQLEHVYERFIEWKIVRFTTEKVLELGRALVETTLHVTDFGYQAEVALRHLNNEVVGFAPRSTRMLEDIKKFALETGQPLEQMEEAFLGLKRAGLADETLKPLISAAGDLASLAGHPENFRPLLETFEQISLRGELTGLQLRTLSTAGISPAALAAKFGAKDFRTLQEQLEKTPIPAIKALQSIQELIKQTAHENVIGDTWKESMNTFAGGINRLKDTWEIMIEDLNEDPIFKSLRDDFTSLVNTVIGHKSQIEEAFKKIVDPILQTIDNLVKNPKALSDFFEDAIPFAKELGSLVKDLVEIVKFLGRHPNLLTAAPAAAIGAKYGGVPGAIVGGGLGYTFGPQTASEASYRKSQFGAATEGPEQYIGSHAAGGPIPEEGMAHLHAGEFVVPAGGALVQRSGGKGGGGHSIDAPITINVHVDGGHGMTEEGLSLRLQEILPGVLVPAREQLATTVGAA